MNDDFIIKINIESNKEEKDAVLPRFTPVALLLKPIERKFNLKGDNFCLYSDDWFRFLEIDKTLDEQYIQDGFKLKIVELNDN